MNSFAKKNMPLFKKNIVSLFILFFFNGSVMATESNTSSGNTSSENASSNSVMLSPIILTLAIPEADKNNPVIIKTTQLSVIKKLEPYQTENIRQYTSLPFLALSVDAEGLAFLKKSDAIKSISSDGVSYPLSISKNKDLDEADIDNTRSSKSPCR